MGKVFPQVRLNGKNAQEKAKAATYVRRGQQELFSLREMQRTSKRPVLQRVVNIDDYTTILVQIVRGQEFIDITYTTPPPPPPPPEPEEIPEEEYSGCTPGFIVYNRESAAGSTAHYGYVISQDINGKWVKTSTNLLRGGESYWAGMAWHFDSKNNSPYYSIGSDAVEAKFPGIGECSLITWRDDFAGAQPTMKWSEGMWRENLFPTESYGNSTYIHREEIFIAGVRVRTPASSLLYGACLLPDTDLEKDFVYILTSDQIPSRSPQNYWDSWWTYYIEVYRLELSELKTGAAYNNWDLVAKVSRADLVTAGYEDSEVSNPELHVHSSPYISPEGKVYQSFATWIRGVSTFPATFYPHGGAIHDDTLMGSGALLMGSGDTVNVIPVLSFQIDAWNDNGSPSSNNYTLVTELDAEKDGLWPTATLGDVYHIGTMANWFWHWEGLSTLNPLADPPSPPDTCAFNRAEHAACRQSLPQATPFYMSSGLDDVYTLRAYTNYEGQFLEQGNSTLKNFPLANPGTYPYAPEHNWAYDWSTKFTVGPAFERTTIALVKGKNASGEKTLWEFNTYEAHRTGGSGSSSRTVEDDGRDWYPASNQDSRINAPFSNDALSQDGSVFTYNDVYTTTTITERLIVFYHPHIDLFAYLERTVVLHPSDDLAVTGAMTGTLSYYVNNEVVWTAQAPASTWHGNDSVFTGNNRSHVSVDPRSGSVSMAYNAADMYSSYGVAARVWDNLVRIANNTTRIFRQSDEYTVGYYPSRNPDNTHANWLTYEPYAGTCMWTSCAVHPHKLLDSNSTRPYMVYLRNLRINLGADAAKWYVALRFMTVGHELYDPESLLYVQASGYGPVVDGVNTGLDDRDGTFYSNFITLNNLQKLVGENSDFPISFGLV